MRLIRHDRYNEVQGRCGPMSPRPGTFRRWLDSLFGASVRLSICLLLAVFCGDESRAADASPSDIVYRDALRRLTGHADAAGAQEWLKQHSASGTTYASLRRTIADLSHADFQLRDRASRALREAAYVPEALLITTTGAARDSAANNKPEEVSAESAWRRVEVTRMAGARQRYAAFCAVQVVRAAPAEHAAETLIGFLPNVHDRQLIHAIWQTLRQIARPSDLARFQTLRATEDTAQRAGASAALGLVTDRVAEFVREARAEQSDEVRLAAAISLAERNEPAGLELLEELLAAPQPTIRREADRALQLLSGHNVGFDAEGDETERREAVTRWRQRREVQPSAHSPLRATLWELTGRGVVGGQTRDGHWQNKTLVATGSHGLLLELVPDGQVVWRYPQSAWSLERLPGGRLLVAALDEQRVLELDRSGRIHWEFGPVAATRAKPLANSNRLIVDFHGARVLEVNRQRQIVQTLPTTDPCFDAEQLGNGHLVFGCANLVREVAPDGFVVREWKISGRLNGIQCLPDDHLLVANYGANEVAEYDRDGRVVRRIVEEQPCDARRLADGHTLVTTSSRVVEYSERGEMVRVWSAARYGTARRDTVE